MVARLHHERIGTASRALLITHGILGSGANWRSIARKLVANRPDWCVELVDLRGHGRSEQGDPPHTLDACARDLRALLDELPEIVATAGHSFGGKTVLALRAIAPIRLQHTFVMDASPSTRGAKDTNVAAVLSSLDRLPGPWASREAFIAAIGTDGHDRGLAQWLAMSLVAKDGALALRFDLAQIHEMIASYAATDLWPVALDPDLPGDVTFLYAADSATLTDDDRTRELPPHVHRSRIERAGHWLHIDAPDAVVGELTTRLPGR